MKLDPKFIVHASQGEHITVSTTGTKFNGLIRSNPTAAFIIDCLKTDSTESQIVDKVAARYDAPRPVIEKDVAELIAKLRKIEAVID